MSYGLSRYGGSSDAPRATAFRVASGSDGDFLVTSIVEDEISHASPSLAARDALSRCYFHDTNAPWHTSPDVDLPDFAGLRAQTTKRWESSPAIAGCFLIPRLGRSIGSTRFARNVEVEAGLTRIGFGNLTASSDHDVVGKMIETSQSPSKSRSQVKAHFRTLRHLHANHDREGAAAADQLSIVSALAIIDQISSPIPFYATLNDDGLAVVEFEDRATGDYGDITFHGDDWVEVYVRLAGQPSQYSEGKLDSPSVRELLTIGLGVFS